MFASTSLERGATAPLFDCLLQFCRCAFDFGVAVLASSGFHSEQAAAMHIFEIAIRESVSVLRIRTVPLVDPEVPFCIFAESVPTDELVLLVC